MHPTPFGLVESAAFIVIVAFRKLQSGAIGALAFASMRVMNLFMTLNLHLVSPLICIAASDRRLSLVERRLGRLTEYDANSNKMVIAASHDCGVAITYSGLAHIDGRCTDDWIASQLFADGFPAEAERAIVSTGEGAPGLNFGSIIGRIKTGLEDRSLRTTSVLRRHPIEVQFSGWRIWKRLFVPFFIKLIANGSVPLTVTNTPWRVCEMSKGSAILEPSLGWREEYAPRFAEMFRSVTRSVPMASVDYEAFANECETQFTNFYRNFALEHHTIGDRIMIARIPPPRFGNIIVSYRETRPPQQTIPNGHKDFTPWVITNGLWAAPMEVDSPVVDGFTFSFGGRQKIEMLGYRDAMQRPERFWLRAHSRMGPP